MNFFDKHDIIHKHQFGFQKGKSTEHAMLDIYITIINALETKDKACCIFLDFAKAFDTVNYKIQIKIQLKYSIPLKLTRSYHSQRTQCVKIEENKSSFKYFTFGIP